MSGRWEAVVAYAAFGLTLASLWLTWFDGQRTRALLRGLLRRDNRK
jgi:hypothetical protein